MRIPKLSVTIKPSTVDQTKLISILDQRVDMIRLVYLPYFATELLENLKIIKDYILDKNVHIDILLDIPGNKIRLGTLNNDYKILIPDSKYILTQSQESINNSIPINSPNFIDMCQNGDKVILGDGDAILEILCKDKEKVIAKNLYQSKIFSRKGIAIQGKDAHLINMDNRLLRESVDLVTRYDLSWIALSFVSNPEQILSLKNKLLENKNSFTKVMSKIESSSGLTNLEEIINNSDGIMVARGDLMVYVDYSLLGINQHRIIEQCKNKNTFCMVSTGMMLGILEKALPNPADIIDITNSILSGVDAIQLCEETSQNENPAYAISVAKKIINTVLFY